MRHLTRRAFLPFAAVAPRAISQVAQSASHHSESDHDANYTMWFRSPASNWIDALSIGNGRLGGMVFGGATEDRISLNEDTLYSGYPSDGNNPGAKNKLAAVRKAVLEDENNHLADQICKEMQGPYGEAYQPLGDMYVTLTGDAESHEEVREYRRELNLDTAIARTTFRLGNVHVTKQCFVSHPDNVLVMSIDASEPVTVTVRLDSQLQHVADVNDAAFVIRGKAPVVSRPNYLKTDNPIQYSDEAGKGMYFVSEARVLSKDGKRAAQ
ncbi:glycoside hydrolase family 95 protein [Terriglobus albidus]|uniref:glycoside hydrolase family 95 protein n=1 Tax=Terriglobus albidus TaxID=1592106 RepID=UPI001C9C1C38|nr:glycoside hydrolase family 95 protein [Terriglobus albidus]